MAVTIINFSAKGHSSSDMKLELVLGDELFLAEKVTRKKLVGSG